MAAGGRYAAGTEVSSSRSREEIERTLTRYGADSFAYGWSGTNAVIAFRMNARHVKFEVPLPDRNDEAFKYTPARGFERSAEQQAEAYEQAVRQKWRALALVVKAKLEAVEAGISEFETEFLGHIVLPNGETVGQWMRPQVAEAYASGAMPEALMLGLPAPKAKE